MKFFSKLERKFGRYAVKDLPRYIVMLYAAGLLVLFVSPQMYFQFLSLDGGAILHGQVWRIITFMMYPPVVFGGRIGLVDVILNIMIIPTYYFLGSTLERVWGSFRFNVYFLLGILGHVLGAVVCYLIWGVNLYLTPMFLNFSLFIAFALMFPDIEFFIWGLLPVKAKYLAIAETARNNSVI